ncbi:MAG: hypothetical protein MUF59_09930 [Candidatus Krumholzibacteria bacterium]|nr:hypothetical protein [Candidatus Krumholzibacteria bacterium]
MKPAGQHLVQRDPHRPDIGPRVGRFARYLFGRGISERSRSARCRICRAGIDLTGEPEIGYLRPSARPLDNDIGRFDVAMDYPLFVRALEAVGDLGDYIYRFREGQRSFIDHLPQRRPFAVGHHDERDPLELLDLVDRADILMVERGGGACLPDEMLVGLFGGDHRGCNEFEGDFAAEPGVDRLVDDPHAAFTDLLNDPVMGYSSADHRPASSIFRMFLSRSMCKQILTRPGGKIKINMACPGASACVRDRQWLQCHPAANTGFGTGRMESWKK